MKSIFKVFAKTTNSSNSSFSIKQNENFYYVVSLKKSVVLFTKEKSQAQELINKLEEMYDWKNVNCLESLRENHPEFYEKIRPILRTYAVPNTFNGNYLSTLDEHKNVNYRLEKSSTLTSGKHLTNGLAIRYDKGLFHLDNIATGKVLTSNENEDILISLYNHTKSYIPWSSGKIPDVIAEDKEFSSYLKNVKEALIKNNTLIPTPEPLMVSRVQFRIYGSSDNEKIKAFEIAMEKLHSMVGLEKVKQKIDEIIKGVAATKRLREMNLAMEDDILHSLFIGPPGTGKTELARILPDLFWSLDMIQERKMVELSKEDLVGDIIGGTEAITRQKITSALGGILFVDEAYTLKGSGASNEQDFGKIALQIIMRAMSNHPGDELVVIFAGYPKDIDDLMNVNDGLRSRFSLIFEFEDLSPFDLCEVANRMLRKKGFITSEIQEQLKSLISSKAIQGSLQANARDVRVLVDEIVRKHKVRIVNENGHPIIIHPSDITSVHHINKIKSNEGLNKLKEDTEEELHRLVGMEEFKEEIQTWTNYVKFEKMRFDAGEEQDKLYLHMSFKGSPGVGKTTAARLVGKLLKANGLLSGGQLIEVKGGDLVAGYLGHTTGKVDELIKKAAGGVLFIDEAYSMVTGKDDMYGHQAVAALITGMENKDLVVIFAGYTKEIDELFKTNPGFPSRVTTHFNFEDYTTDQLFEIFQLKSNKLEMDAETKDLALSLIRDAKVQGKTGSNGRWIRTFIQKIKMAQSNRLEKEGTNDFRRITSSDIKNGFEKI
ncbi:AAA family ATPase [[Brevibacterium] frigoritolerans]|nr:AAA family ATPase [Peribacillus frigoritolerans]